MSDPESILFSRRKERFDERRRDADQRKLRDEFFDHATLICISRLVSQGQFESIDFPIATGKEGGVFRATGPEGFRAVKVYRIGNAVFRRLPAYAMEELRREASERNYGRLVAAWTRREHTTLRKMDAAGVRVPRPFGYLRNILVMDFIGEDGAPSPRLQDAEVTDPAALYRAIVDQFARMTRGARLVHGDLSPYNVLLRDGVPVVIDVAQAVSVDHPQARELLERDTTNFSRYLKKVGYDVDPDEFFAAAGGDEIAAPEAP